MRPQSPCAPSSTSQPLQDLGERSTAHLLQRVPIGPPAPGVAVQSTNEGPPSFSPWRREAQFARDVRDGMENRSTCPYTWRSTTHT
jgi:hypothetical protein